MSVKGLVDDALSAASCAVEFDKSGRPDVAIYYYKEAAKFLELFLKNEDAYSTSNLKEKALDYKKRADVLDQFLKANEAQQPESQSEGQKLLQQCSFSLNQALDADEHGLKEEAVQLYMQAVELGIAAKSKSVEKEICSKLETLTLQALERAEALKGIKPPEKQGIPENEPMPPIPKVPVIPVQGSSKPVPQLHRGSSAHLKVSGGKETYTEEEKKVLLRTSNINRREYVPFMSIDLSEKFQYAIPFTDKDGPLILSPKQKVEFSRWDRLEDLCSDPKMMVGTHVDYYSIKQTVVSDCSFVASLAVSALYEKKFGRRLVTSIIYPRNKNKEPIYNPYGKYMVKLHINGVPRKVIIDDTLPVGKRGQLLCSYSTNKNEFWISLLEKAYMKVMGGYDFPGSNSNIDLHALTGWIPERVAIRSKDEDFNSSSLFDQLLQRLDKGDVLVTVATGELSDAESDRTGLVSTHAYAVLSVKKLNGINLLQLKNPWSHLRWRGNYSELDATHWTPELKQQLNFDPNNAAMFDNGIFWIDYESILRFFDVFYLSWNPSLFNYTYCIHQSWQAGTGPIKDAYNIGENPQFSLSVDGDVGSVWILLTRHIMDLEDFKENREYITVLIYRNDGKRVYYPNDPYIDGVRINSPHYLCKIILNKKTPRRYTLVISQYEKMHTIFYTLRVYSTCPFSLKKIENTFRHTKQVSDGQWKGITAGGCGNHPNTYPNNPRYQLQLDSTSHVLLELKGPKQYQIGLDVVCNESSDPEVVNTFGRKSSGAFRSGFVVLDLENVPAGTYHIIPSTFFPQQEGPFFLQIKSSNNFKLSRIQ